MAACSYFDRVFGVLRRFRVDRCICAKRAQNTVYGTNN